MDGNQLIPNAPTQDEINNAAKYAFNAPTTDDIIRYLTAQRAQQAAQASAQPDLASVSPAPVQPAPTQQEQAAAAQLAPTVASHAASVAAQAQNNTAADTGFNQQLNNVVSQANAAGIARPMSLGERGILSQILGAKDMYNAAKDDAGRASAHALADAYRQAGTQYGLNDTSAGLDATQLRALLQTDYDMGVNNAMRGKTSAEYFDEQYNALRQAGLTRREASDEAARRAERYQNERVRNLTNDFYTYGVNPDGYMNNNGAAILNLIYDEQPQAAAMGMQNYATPIMGWKFNENQEAVNNAYNQKVDFGQRTFGWNKQLMDDKIAAQESMQNAQLEAQKYAVNAKIAAQKYALDHAPKVVRSSGGGPGGSKSGGATKSQNGWLNKLQTLKQLAYQSLGTPDKPGTMFSDENDHNVENYREELYKFRESGDADESDKDWVDQELERLQNDVEAVSKSGS